MKKTLAERLLESNGTKLVECSTPQELVQELITAGFDASDSGDAVSAYDDDKQIQFDFWFRGPDQFDLTVQGYKHDIDAGQGLTGREAIDLAQSIDENWMRENDDSDPDHGQDPGDYMEDDNLPPL